MVEIEPRVIGLLFALGFALGIYVGYETAIRRLERMRRGRR